MSWIFTTALIVATGFALAFALCEWFVRRHSHRDDVERAQRGDEEQAGW